MSIKKKEFIIAHLLARTLIEPYGSQAASVIGNGHSCEDRI